MQQLVRFAAAMVIAAGSTLSAQQPMPGPGGPPQGGPGGAMAGATFLLSHTGDLQLTDQQVVKLAGIARREATRRKAMMTSMDSVRRSLAAVPRDSVRRRMGNPQMMSRMTQARDQMQTDLRDAIAVLTPDQQAQAWTMVSRRGAMGGAMRNRGMERMRDRRQPGMDRGPRPEEGQGPRPNGMRGRAGGAPGGQPPMGGRMMRPRVRPPVE